VPDLVGHEVVEAGARLHVGLVAGRSVVLAAQATSPLKLLTPDNHGRAVWVYQSSYGGGLVGADAVSLEVQVDAGAALFLTTQASSKVYRAARAQVTLEARLGDDALWVSWPDPVVCFEGAALVQRQVVHASASAGLVLVDAYTSGRAARGERWRFDAFESRLSLNIAGAPALREAVTLCAAHGSLVDRLQAFDAFATVVVAGPALQPVASQLEAQVKRLAPGLAAASRTRFGVVLRLGASDAGELAVTLRALLGEPVRALLGDDPLARKW
jgi:urease accessory protein